MVLWSSTTSVFIILLFVFFFTSVDLIHLFFLLLKEMRKLAREWSPDLRQIDLDVNRTYRDHLMFRERYGLKQQALFHILGAYSVYNSEIGMCFFLL